MDLYNDLEEMCETLSRELKKANEKIDGGDITAGDMAYIDGITHSLKSIKTIMAMMDAESYDGYSRDNYSREGNSRDGYSRGNSYARKRRRDSRGRYASEGYSGRRGYSRDDEMISELRGLMEDAPDEQTKQEFQRLISKMENM